MPRRSTSLIHPHVLLALLITLGLQAGAGAELCDVYLTSGVRLRADVTVLEHEVVLRNEAGVLRLPRSAVERIIPVPTIATQPAPEVPVATQPAPEPTTVPVKPVVPPPLLTEEDIQRLKLHELNLSEPADAVRVQFLRGPRERPLPLEVLEEVRPRPDFEPEWERILTGGRPYEQLRLIVRLTGARHRERIVIHNDPALFDTFRRRIVPLVERGCARGGCHIGTAAQLFSFPRGGSEEVNDYTCFVLLDQMEAADGPLLNRAHPGESALLHYLLPQEDSPHPHPPVEGGPPYKAVLRGVEDPWYQRVLSWIAALRVPRPEYGLTYENPYAGRLMSTSQPAADQP